MQQWQEITVGPAEPPFPAMRRLTLGAGVGVAPFELVAFDRALRAAGFADYNLVRISSIVPPGVIIRPQVELPKGFPLPIAYGVLTSHQQGERIAAAVAVALPTDSQAIGVIMEVSGSMTRREAHAQAEAMAELAMHDRHLSIARIEVVAVEAIVEQFTSVFAGAALW
ncbi:Pyruvoyl-dependent arginine decarboxylase [bacterium HR15]|nr:Pyruvoyl-dependent arginine decarboxylase [bacterium HR15]